MYPMIRSFTGLLTGLALIHPSILWAGAVSGGGAKSVVCRNHDTHEIRSAELLDLYEARLLYHRQILSSTAPVDQQIRDALSKIPPNAWNHYLDEAFAIEKNLNLLGNDVRLLDVNDAVEVAFPKDCALEQLVNFVNSQAILASAEIWNKLDSTNRAALLVHEAIYKHEREYANATDSRRTRNMTSMLFSSQRDQLVDVRKDIPANREDTDGDDNYKCSAGVDGSSPLPEFEFFAYRVDDNYILQFTVIGHQERLSKTVLPLGDKPQFFQETCNGSPADPRHCGNYSVDGVTQATFEGGDRIFFSTGSTLNEYSGYISGASGWVPGLTFPRAEYTCQLIY